MYKKKILFILGTRPEAIKLAPLIKKFKKSTRFEVKVCNTEQHKEMSTEILKFFEINSDYNLDIMTENQSLPDLLSKLMVQITKVLDTFIPNLVFVQGDTTTAFAGALSSFYKKIEVAHIEAGLRSDDKNSPFPEEINRVFISKIADYHFAPTAMAFERLKKEGITKNVWVVGNTVVDAIIDSDKMMAGESTSLQSYIKKDNKIVLLTCHRRENFGKPLLEICRVVKRISESDENIQIIFPVHPNPNVREIINKELSNLRNVSLIEPLPYFELLKLIKHSYLILTDSGGIQEEAPSFGKPVVVMRTVTERMEGILSGNAILGGNTYSSLWPVIKNILTNKEIYEEMSEARNPYGDGTACEQIFEEISLALK